MGRYDSFPKGWDSRHADEAGRLSSSVRDRPLTDRDFGGGYAAREARYALAEQGVRTVGHAVEAGADQVTKRGHLGDRTELGIRATLSDHSDRSWRRKDGGPSW